MIPSAPQAGYLLRSWTGIVRWILFFVLSFLQPSMLWATTYYVDATLGNNLNDGKSEGVGGAWKTVGQVNVTGFNAGDQILFKRGEVWHESLVVSSSGTASAPITFGAYGSGDLPLFDGAASVTWTSGGGNIYTASWPGSDPGLLVYKGVAKPSITTLQFALVPTALKKNAVLLQKDIHYTNLWVTSTSGNTVSGITFFPIYETENVYVRQLNTSGKEETWSSSLGHPTRITSLAGLTEPGHWYWDNDTLYLYSDIDPNTIDVEVGQLATGIRASGKNYLNIEDLAVRGYQDTGVLLLGTLGVVVQGVEVSNIGAASPYKTGILLMNATGNTVKNNRVDSALRVGIGIYATGSTNSHTNTVSGNTVVNSGSTGISLNTDGSADAVLVQDNIIDGNTIIRANELSYDSAGIYLLNIGAGNVLKNNIITDGGSKYLRSAGIMADGGTSPLEIFSNRIENNSLGGVVVTGAGHRITRNSLTDNGVASWESAQILFFTVTGNASDCFVQSNTVEAHGSQKLFLVVNGTSTTGDLPHDIDYNTYRSEDPNGFCWNDGWVCDQWVNLSSWKSETGQDAHSGFSLITTPTPSPPSGKSITGVYRLLL